MTNTVTLATENQKLLSLRESRRQQKPKLATPRHINVTLDSLVKRIKVVDLPSPPPPRQVSNVTYKRKPFNQFSFDHLNEHQTQQLARAIRLANGWIGNHVDGLSMIVTGTNGAGKTNIAQNCAWSLSETVFANDETVYLPRHKSFSGADVMGLFDKDDTPVIPLSKTLDRLRAIIIDDVGTTEGIASYPHDPAESRIQRRYHYLIQHCYQNSISMLVTTELPYTVTLDKGQLTRSIGTVPTSNGDFVVVANPQLVKVFGRSGYDRLVQMCQGHHIQLNLPSFRKTS